MTHLFVPYEIALKLKELKFNDPCIAIWNMELDQPDIDELGDICQNEDDWIQDAGGKYCAAPLYQQVVDWFRDKHDLFIYINSMAFGYISGHDNTPDPSTWGKDRRWRSKPYSGYYEAYDAAIHEALNRL